MRYWTAARLLELLEHVDSLRGTQSANACCRVCLSPLGDEYDFVVLGESPIFGWSGSCDPADQSQLERLASALDATLARFQSDHTTATGGPVESLDVYIWRHDDKWTFGLWPEPRRRTTQ